MALSHHPTFCGPKNEKYLSGFDVQGLAGPLGRTALIDAHLMINDK